MCNTALGYAVKQVHVASNPAPDRIQWTAPARLPATSGGTAPRQIRGLPTSRAASSKAPHSTVWGDARAKALTPAHCRNCRVTPTA
jgi:hypothetical protein